MARIPEHIVENVRQVADIHDVISDYVNLKKRGRNFFGLCPFHNEKTPSFSINMDKQIYKCFGCGKGGGTINFIMDIERLDFVDAIKYLGNKYNIQVEIEHNSKSNKDLFNQLYSINEIANQYYKKNINENIIKILNDRNINENSIKTFEIGFSINKYDELLNIIRNQKYSAESLKKSGLFIDHEKGYMDRFRNRMIFPIYSHLNKVIGFAGRIIDDQKQAKYVNSPETPIYNKRRVLYGFHLNKNEIINQKAAIIVEGYFDLIQLYQANIKNVVAVSGTAFTDEHALAISKLCKIIYIAYDGDNAGKEAAIRAGYTTLKNNLNVKIINIPNKLDPDDWIQTQGPEPFKEAYTNAEDLLNFHYKNQAQEIQTDHEKIEFINTVLLELNDIDNELAVESLSKQLSEITSFNIDTILNSLKKIKSNKNKYKKIIANKEIIPEIIEDKISSVEKELIAFCFAKNIKVRKFIKTYLNVEWIQSVLIQNIYNQIYMHLSSESIVEPEIIMNELKDELSRNLMAELIFDELEVNKTMAIDCITRIEQNMIQTQLNNLRTKLKTDDSMELVQKITELQKNKNDVKKKYLDV